MLGEPQLSQIANPDFCDRTYEDIMRLLRLTGVAFQYIGEELATYVDKSFRGRMQNPWVPVYTNEQSLHRRMVEHGWCPIIRTVMTSNKTNFVEYAAIVGPPSMRLTHDSCSANGCVPNNIDESTYEHIHVRQNCQCTFLRPNLHEIAQILDSGGFSLVNLNRASEIEGKKTVEVVPFEKNK